MVASAWLGARRSQRQDRWAPTLEPLNWLLPFTVVAEMRFGAEIAGWGARRRGALERLVDGGTTVPPLDSVVDAYVDLRTWASRNGHGQSFLWLWERCPGCLPHGSGRCIVTSIPTL